MQNTYLNNHFVNFHHTLLHKPDKNAENGLQEWQYSITKVEKMNALTIAGEGTDGVYTRSLRGNYEDLEF